MTTIRNYMNRKIFVERFFFYCCLALLIVLGTGATLNATEAKMPVAKFGDNKVKLEVADTEAKIERGLMFRTSLEKDSGMVFLFDPHRKVKFWMFNCFIPLDMIFIRDGKVAKIAENVPPCKSKNPRECPTYPEEAVDVDKVVEVNAGYCKKHGIKEGDSVEFSFQ